MAVLLAIGGLALITQQVVRTQASPVALPYSKGFLITGGYAVGSVDLAPSSGGGGFLTGTINMSGVPANAEILAAYLYWQTIATDVDQIDFPKFRGEPITVAKETRIPLQPSTAPCWSGGSSNNTYVMYGMRADVKRLLPETRDANGLHTWVNSSDLGPFGPHTVTLPDAGSGNQVPTTAGATLLVIYKDMSKPLTSITLYDGLHVQAPNTTTNHTFAGFLGATSSPNARMTQIASAGGNNSSERLYFNNTIIASDPFGGSGPSSDRTWTTVSYNISNALMNQKTNSSTYGEQVTTKIDHTSSSPYECIAWSAMVFSTEVRDADADGLPDRLEESNGLKSPDGVLLPDLNAMGARNNRKDLFIEIGALTADAGTSYGGQVDSEGHNHLPTPAVLAKVGKAYRDAPVGGGASGLLPGIAVHFDVGPYYKSLTGYGSNEADEFLITSAQYARGGETAKEVDCAVFDPGCQFAGYPGTVSWKIGYQLIRDGAVNTTTGAELSPSELAACEGNNNCRRRFDAERMNYFHYVLYAHYRAKPMDLCLTGDAAAREACRASALYHTPSTASGIADYPGGADHMVTLGGWGHKFVGSEFIQASTTLHEMGHAHGLSHGGSSANINEPNCKPNYLSVMNYLFQLTGLRDEAGVAHLDYSTSINGVVNENVLGGDPLNPIHLQYRTAWFAPLKPGTLPYALGSPAAARHCNGSALPSPLPDNWVPMARVDAYSATLESIDWSAGLNAGPPQDVNFDGDLDAALAGYSDWANLRLDQIGTRRNMAGFSLGMDLMWGVDVSGGVDISGGVDWDGPDYHFGVDVSGGVDEDFFGVDVSGGVDFGGDVDYSFGVDVSGGVDDPFFFGVDVSGGGEEFFGVDVSGGQEIDRDLAIAMGNTPANEVKACVIGTPQCPQGFDPLHRVRIGWKEPDVGDPTSYSVYRVQGSSVSPLSQPVLVGTVPGTQTSLVDTTQLPNGVAFTYFVKVLFVDAQGGGSNFSTVIAVNDAPGATADNFTVGQGAPLANNVLTNDPTDNDSPVSADRPLPVVAALVSGPSHATAFTLNPDGTFNYTPANGFAGTDQFTYRANNGTWDGPPSANMSNNSSDVIVSITVIDGTPPVVTLTVPTPNGNAGWFKTSPVNLTVVATDPSNVVSITCLDNGSPAPMNTSGLGTGTAQATVSIAAQGTHTVICTAVDGRGNNGAAPGSNNTGSLKIDSVAPTVTNTIPADNAMYILRSSVNANFGCSDPTPGSGMAGCAGTVNSGSAIDTSTVGPKTFTVTGTDVAGNQYTKTINYLVIYAFTMQSFKSPANLGSAVPLNWVLKDALGATISSLSTLVKMESVFNGGGNNCTASANGPKTILYDPATGAKGGSDFRLVSGGYAFNWATGFGTTGKGCYSVLITLNDGSPAKLVGPIQLK